MTTARTGVCRLVSIWAKYFENGAAESLANAQYVRDVEVKPAAFATTAVMEKIKTMTVAPAWLFVMLRNNCMKGKPVAVSRRLSKSPRENRSIKAQPKPIIPFTTTLPTIAIGTFRAGYGISSAICVAASYLWPLASAFEESQTPNLPKKRINRAQGADKPRNTITSPSARVTDFHKDIMRVVLGCHDT